MALEQTLAQAAVVVALALLAEMLAAALLVMAEMEQLPLFLVRLSLTLAAGVVEPTLILLLLAEQVAVEPEAGFPVHPEAPLEPLTQAAAVADQEVLVPMAVQAAPASSF